MHKSYVLPCFETNEVSIIENCHYICGFYVTHVKNVLKLSFKKSMNK